MRFQRGASYNVDALVASRSVSTRTRKREMVELMHPVRSQPQPHFPFEFSFETIETRKTEERERLRLLGNNF